MFIVRVSWWGGGGVCQCLSWGLQIAECFCAYWPLSHASILMLMTFRMAVTGNCAWKLISYIIVTVKYHQSYLLWAGCVPPAPPHHWFPSCPPPVGPQRSSLEGVVTGGSSHSWWLVQAQPADVPAGFVLRWNRRSPAWHIESNLLSKSYFHKTPLSSLCKIEHTWQLTPSRWPKCFA